MDILELAWNTKLNYKGIPVNLFGVPRLRAGKKPCSQTTFNRTVLRMKTKGYLEIIDDRWQLTEYGKKFYENRQKLRTRFSSPFPPNATKNLLVIFDIPETKRNERNWLRWHLKNFQYIMLQQSVWLGPSPLPTKFREHLKNFKLDKCIKTFKLAKPYQSKG